MRNSIHCTRTTMRRWTGLVDTDRAKTSYKVFWQEFVRSVWVTIDKKTRRALVDCLQFGLTRLCSLSYTAAAAEVSLLHLTILLFHQYLDGACTMFGFWVRSNYRLQLILKFAVAVNRSRESLQWLEYSRVTGESRQWASSKSCSAAVTVLQNTSTRYMEKYFQFLQSGKYQTFLFLIWLLGIHTDREVQSGIRFRSISK